MADGRAGGRLDADGISKITDRRWLVMTMMTLCGAGFLFPFNSYIVAVDYLEERYPTFSPEFVIPFVYIYITCIFVGSNLVYGVGKVTIKNRIRFGYLLFILSLASVPLVEKGIENKLISRGAGFWLTLLSVSLVAVGGGIQQSSFYGFAAFLPPMYTQGLMFGESLAGVIVSFNRIWTKASYEETPEGLRDSTFLFFYMSIIFIIICVVLHEVASESKFSLHYSNRLSTPIESQSTGTDDDGESLLPAASSSAVLLRNRGTISSAEGDGASSDGGGGGGGLATCHTDEAASGSGSILPAETPKQRRRRVAGMVVSPMLAVAGSFIVTLSVFPGVTSAVPSSRWTDWMPIIMMAVFNLGDLIGKALPFLPVPWLSARSWTAAGLLKVVAARIPLIIILVLCAAPYPLPALKGEGWGLVSVLVLAITGGYTATIAMTIGPLQVPAEDRETAGATMTLALLCGLAAGSTVALAFSSIKFANSNFTNGTHANNTTAT